MTLLYGSAPLFTPDDAAGNDEEERDREEEQGEFAFRLFAGEDARRIVIREEDLGNGAFLRGRDPRVFVVGRAQGQRRAGIESVAVSGEEVLRRKGERAWGLEVPWRVVVVRDVRRGRGTMTTTTRDGLSGRGEEMVGDEKRKKAGKRKRIAMRVKRRREEGEREKREREEKEKEEREREKRIRRNKGKKIKRKMKEKEEKAKKSGTGTAEGSVGSVGSVIADPPLSVGEQGG